MPVTSSNPVTGTSINMLVCVDAHDADKMSGTLYNRLIAEPFIFRDIVQLTDKMDEIFNAVSFPQSFFTVRTFGASKPAKGPSQKEVINYMSQEEMLDHQGARGTFLVTVQFRQNATWQGTIAWMNQNKKQSFRSALEMIKLMDEALAMEASAGTEAKWE